MIKRDKEIKNDLRFISSRLLSLMELFRSSLNLLTQPKHSTSPLWELVTPAVSLITGLNNVPIKTTTWNSHPSSKQVSHWKSNKVGGGLPKLVFGAQTGGISHISGGRSLGTSLGQVLTHPRIGKGSHTCHLHGPNQGNSQLTLEHPTTLSQNFPDPLFPSPSLCQGWQYSFSTLSYPAFLMCLQRSNL